MLGDDLCAVSWRARPGSFVGLMTLYESNYIRLGWLVGNLRALTGAHCSRVADDCALRLTVLAHGRYTSMLTLTYVFSDSAGLADMPDLEVRVYHDARVAEARAFGSGGANNRLRVASEAEAESLGARWARNMMLNKWLEYCVDRGHHFGAAAR